MSEIWLSQKEVTALEKLTESGFWARFKRNYYKIFRYVESEKGGGKNGQKLEIALSSLNPEVRNRVIQEKESGYLRHIILPSRADLSMAEAKELIKKFEAAPLWSRRKAEARAEIIKSFTEFSAGRKITPAKNTFLNKYNAQNPELGIPPEVYDIISELTRPTLDRWRGGYKELGLVGLLVKANNSRPKTKIEPEIRKYILALLAAKPHKRPARIYEYVKNKFASQENPPLRHSATKTADKKKGGQEVRRASPLPAEITIRRFMARWKEEKEDLYTFLKNPDKWRSDFQLALGDGSEKAKYFLHMLEFDSTPADIMCADKKRYTLIGAIDIFSRKAKCLLVPVSKSIAIANLMRWVILNWGLFDVMIADNGRDYASRHIEVACGALNIEMPPVPTSTPEAKPHIERFFGTISTMLFEELDGYIGHNVAERKDIESRRSFAQRMFDKDEVIECRMMPDELQDIINTWLAKIYLQREHSELGKSPEAKAAESSQPVRKIMDEQVLDILLAPCGHPIVQKKGIRYKNGIYVAPELGDYVKKKVEIRENLTDAGKVYVFEMESKARICIAIDASLGGLTVEEVTRARKQQTKNIRDRARALKTLAKEVGDPMLDLLAAKSKEKGKVFAFHKEEKAEGTMIREAEKIIAEPENTFREFQPDPEEIAEAKKEILGDDKVVELHPEPIFATMYERYRYLLDINRDATAKELDFIKRYEGTQEYYRIFVMPYE